MKIIPAIDIMYRRVVRLEQGKFEKEKVYSGNPIIVAKNWMEKGAKLLHIVDLDGARLGKPVNINVIRDIIKTTGLEVELGGGLRSVENVEKAFEAGVRYCIVGTSAVQDEAFCKYVVKKYADRMIFSVDVKGGVVAIRGWGELSGKAAEEYIKELENIGAKRIIYTDISRDGMLSGPNLETLKVILENTTLEVIASGGISSIENIKVLKEYEKKGLVGVIIGKALYEGKLDLKEAINAS